MSVNTEAADLLLAARDDLLANGWIQNKYGNSGKSGVPVCALGALRRQQHVYGRGWHALMDAQRALRYHLARESPGPRGRTRITDWNDLPGRTLDDVTAALTATAAQLKERDV